MYLIFLNRYFEKRRCWNDIATTSLQYFMTTLLACKPTQFVCVCNICARLGARLYQINCGTGATLSTSYEMGKNIIKCSSELPDWYNKGETDNRLII